MVLRYGGSVPCTKGMCVQTQRSEALTFSRKYQWFHVAEAEALRQALMGEGLLEAQVL